MSKLQKLFSIGKIQLGMAAAALAVFGLAAAPLANATPITTPITFYNDASTQTTARFTVGCGSATGSCASMLAAASDSSSPPSWSSLNGQMLDGPSNASPTSEMTYVNGLLGTSFTTNSGNIPAGGSNSFEFTTDAAYFLLKVGNGSTGQAYALLSNLDDSLDVYFTKTGTAGGLSHYITFGPARNDGVPVPGPAALGMFGLGVLLMGGFLALRRRYD